MTTQPLPGSIVDFGGESPHSVVCTEPCASESTSLSCVVYPEDAIMTEGQPLRSTDHGPRPSLGSADLTSSMKLSVVTPRLSSPSDGPTAKQPQEVSWEWEHRTGFIPYVPETNAKIERAYRAGDSKVRLKSGKDMTTPMEIFFEDMLQHDPITGNTRNVRRTGPYSFWIWAEQKMNEFSRFVETGQKRRELFSEYQQRRDLLRHGIDIRDTAVTDYYRRGGFCATVARSGAFFVVTMSMIVLNTMWLWVDTDLNEAPTLASAELHFRLVEYMFCAYFGLEILVRFFAFRRTRDCLKDRWFAFDLTLVILMVLEQWILPVVAKDGSSWANGLAVLRLLRLSRMARLLRALPEMMMLIKGITSAMKSVFYTLCLLVMLLYIFGIIFKHQTQPHPEIQGELFPNVLESMLSLLLYGTFLDGPSSVLNSLKETGAVLPVLFLVFIFMSGFTLLNMLIGILCDVVSQVSQTEREENEVQFLKTNLLGILEVYDKNDDQHINREEFGLLMRNPELHEVLKRFGTSPQGLLQLRDVLYSEAASKDRLSFKEFLQAVLRLRGRNHAHVTDVVELREYTRQRLDHLEDTFQEMRQLAPPRSLAGTASLASTEFASCAADGET